MIPYLADPDVTLYHGDVLETLRELPSASVDCVVTSPPYWGLRDYGTGEWEGGDAGCDHKRYGENPTGRSSTLEGGRQILDVQTEGLYAYREVCGKCGARRVDSQIGLEDTPEAFVARLVDVFRDLRRVLVDHGSVWLNLGDSYSGQGGERTYGSHDGETRRAAAPGPRIAAAGLKAKDLVGIPWRVAFALQADGWYLRSDVIWAKPNPMPESVTDRPTKSHEYVFLLTKRARYYFDQEAVREPADWERWGDQTNGKHEGQETGAGWIGSASKAELQLRKTKNPDGWKTGPGAHGTIHDEGRAQGETKFVVPTGRNIRTVWTIATQPYKDAHFATFPEELARRCIAASSSERGKCPECGAPWTRDVERETDSTQPSRYGKAAEAVEDSGYGRNDVGRGMFVTTSTVGAWTPTCSCDVQPAPCVVLDPFMGSGTVAYVARKLGRRAVGIDLNADYLELAARRLQQQSLFAELA